jgi:DNA-directed RNA polymerase subunit F
MPLAITIPDRYRDGLGAIARLNDKTFSEVYDALTRAPSETPSQKELAAGVAGEVTAIDGEDVKKIVEVLTSLYQVRNRANISPEKLANDVYEAVQKDAPSLVQKQDVAEIKNRLAKFLRLESLNVVTMKAKELQMDVERQFCEARILTDLRPIFGSEVDAPKAMIVVHSLKLGYHDAATGRHEELFVAIDEEDIRKLKEVLDRAERKAKSLVSRLQAAGIRTVELP